MSSITATVNNCYACLMQTLRKFLDAPYLLKLLIAFVGSAALAAVLVLWQQGRLYARSHYLMAHGTATVASLDSRHYEYENSCGRYYCRHYIFRYTYRDQTGHPSRAEHAAY